MELKSALLKLKSCQSRKNALPKSQLLLCSSTFGVKSGIHVLYQGLSTPCRFTLSHITRKNIKKLDQRRLSKLLALVKRLLLNGEELMIIMIMVTMLIMVMVVMEVVMVMMSRNTTEILHDDADDADGGY